jgi:hypothetical protein
MISEARPPRRQREHLAERNRKASQSDWDCSARPSRRWSEPAVRPTSLAVSQPYRYANQVGDYRDATLLKLFDQAAHATVKPYLLAFTGWVLYCRVDRDSVRMRRCCHKMRVHIVRPLLHRREGHLLHRRPWDLPRR